MFESGHKATRSETASFFRFGIAKLTLPTERRRAPQQSVRSTAFSGTSGRGKGRPT